MCTLYNNMCLAFVNARFYYRTMLDHKANIQLYLLLVIQYILL